MRISAASVSCVPSPRSRTSWKSSTAPSRTRLDLANERVDIRVGNTSAMNFSFLTAMGLVLWFGGQKVIAGQISVGTLALLLPFMTILQMPVR